MSLDSPSARALGLSMGLLDAEYDHIERELQRVPTETELTVFAGMWSEHCSYKSTLHWLRELPNTGEHTLAGPGSHAGVVDVGDGWAVAFKIESHNHPSAVEPYQGAATGVGGILRDIIAQGARPCAVMDSLCFGMPGSAHQKHLVEGVVDGIAGYGNAFGVPNIGGRTFFDPRYDQNILVNALAAGLLRHEDMRSAEGARVGDAVLYVGATTGRDGILGAAFASEELADDTVEDRPHVQVGDPFTGKKLMEACMSFGPSDGNIAGQDMGASGVTCGAFEIAAASKVGVDIDLESIPTREAGMAPQEIMLSESQERFVFIVEPGREDDAIRHFQRYGVHATICGRVVEGERVRVRYRGETVVDLPAALVADETPATDWPVADAVPAPTPYPEFELPLDFGRVLLDLLSDPCIADKAPLYDHYDSTVGNRTVRAPDQGEAAVMKLPDSTRGFALTISSRGDLCGADAYLGTLATLAETMRNLACVGAQMIAITDGLNVASPRDPIENKKLERVIAALGDGLREIDVPVTGGNCSLYNESAAGPIPPTPMVGSIGRIDDVKTVPSMALADGQAVVLLGALSGAPHTSRYGHLRSGRYDASTPLADLTQTKTVCEILKQRVRAGRVVAAKDAGMGGIAVAAAKLCLLSGRGMKLSLLNESTDPAARAGHNARRDWLIFGEPPAAFLVVTDDAAGLIAAAQSGGVHVAHIGDIGGTQLVLDDIELELDEMREAFESPLTQVQPASELEDSDLAPPTSDGAPT